MEDSNNLPDQATKRQAAGQLVLCLGCCCGRVERGFPAVPVEKIKAAWKAEKLNSVIQLTVSGCLGPCDLTNVAMVLTPSGSEWFGNLKDDAPYDTLLAWARSCKDAKTLVPLPDAISPYRFDRFTDVGQTFLSATAAQPHTRE